MKEPKIILRIVVATIVVGAVAIGLYFGANPAAARQALAQVGWGQTAPQGTAASGFIEAEEVAIAAELGGRVVELLADEGDDVQAGQTLVRLDGRLLDAQIEAAQAALDTAQAQLAQVRAGAQPELVHEVQAYLAQAEAARDGARQAWQDSLTLRDNPQQIEAQIAQAEAQLAAARAGLQQATALKDAAEIGYNAYWKGVDAYGDAKDKINKLPPDQRPSLPGIPIEAVLVPNAYWKSWVGVNAAQAGVEGAQATLGYLYAMRDNPQQLKAMADAAEARYHATEAAVAMAQAQLEAVQAGATSHQIAMAEAQVKQAQAALDALLVLRNKLTVTAPVGGIVLERIVHPGELAVPGATLLKLGDLDQVTLTVYVPEDHLGQVSIGQMVLVSADTFPGRAFEGTVVAIASQAEFTPRNVQTQAERVNMVFGVDVRISNPDHDLKPGLPADAHLDIK